jgi:hypothetical protein
LLNFTIDHDFIPPNAWRVRLTSAVMHRDEHLRMFLVESLVQMSLEIVEDLVRL